MISNDYLNDLKTKMIADYNRFMPATKPHHYEMQDEYAKGLSFEYGKKYIKIVQRGSAAGFIVNTDKDKQFPLGTLLKSASWASPARNFSRGSIFEEADRAAVRWTGVL